MYEYTLEKYQGMKSRFICPGCSDKRRTFSRYINQETGQYVSELVGRCNREVNCGYHLTPKQYFDSLGLSFNHNNEFKHKQKNFTIIQTPSFISIEHVRESINVIENDFFMEFLARKFGKEKAEIAKSRYLIGYSNHWTRSTIFWQMDIKGKVRTGKIMLYDPITGKRVKQPFNHITWFHTKLRIKDFVLKQCLFGEHLLENKKLPVAIVESEKTAIIASIVFPQLIWLATGSLANLSKDKMMVLTGRDVFLFPDANAFVAWEEKSKEFNFLKSLQVSNLVERKAGLNEKKEGWDLADYLLDVT